MSKDERSEYSVNVDTWDLEDYYAIREEIDALPAATKALLGITDTAREEMADMFGVLKKAVPRLRESEEIQDRFRINRAVNEQAMELQETAEARRYTKGDPVAAAMMLVKIEPRLEEIFDREKIRQQQADKLQELRDELREKLQELIQQLANQPQPQPGDEEGEEEGEGAGAGEGEGEEEGDQEGQGSGSGQGQGEGQGQGQGEGEGNPLQDEIEALQQAIAAAERALEEGLKQDSASIKAGLSRALQSAIGDAKLDRTMAQMCGMEPGQLTKLPAKERLELARKFREHSDLAEIAEYWGPLINLAFSERSRIVDGVPHEVYDVTLGSDLTRLLPSELIRLDDPDMEWGFYRDFAEKRLLNYRVRGRETVGKGGIVFCEDGSYSMWGPNERMGKAIMGTTLDIAKREGRAFHLLHFGGPGEYQILSFEKPEDFTVDRIIEAFEIFFGGGTCFKTPFTEAQRILQEEFEATGKLQCDVVFLTDGLAPLSEEFITNYHEIEDRMQGQTFGINLGPETAEEPLKTICRGKVYRLDDFTNGGREIKHIYRGMAA